MTYIFPNTFRVQEEREHMKDGKFVLDAHTGFWDASKENIKNEYGLAFAETFYAFQSGFNPPDPKWTMDFDKEFRKVDPDWYLHHMFVRGEMDMAILSTQVLMDFYHTGFTNSKRNAEMVARAPERLIGLGGVDPRDKNATRHMREQVEGDGMKGFKWYTAEWRGESRGWKANDPAVFPCYEEAIAMGVKNMHFHKGPAVEPLSMEKFDVYDIDEPSSLYPELNFIVDHIGLPRLDEFCWIAARSTNVYASLAVANAFIHKRPRYFGEMMANLLFWLGEDRIIWGTDFPIWYPHWILDEFMEYQIPDDIADEFGVQLTPEIKAKIIGGNVARLYGIDTDAKLKKIENDEFSQRRKEFLANSATYVGA